MSTKFSTTTLTQLFCEKMLDFKLMDSKLFSKVIPSRQYTLVMGFWHGMV